MDVDDICPPWWPNILWWIHHHVPGPPPPPDPWREQLFRAIAIHDLAEGLSDVPLSHAQTLADAGRAAGDLARLLEAFVERVGRS